MNRLSIVPTLALCCGLAFISGCNRGGPAGAKVDGQAVEMKEVYEHLSVKPTVRAQLPNGLAEVTMPPNQSLGFQALQDLVVQRIVFAWAKEAKVYPTDEEVEKELELRRQVDRAYVQDLQARGLTLEQIRNSLRYDVAQFRLRTQGVTVTDEQVKQRIDGTPELKFIPATVEMQWILVVPDQRDANAAAAKRKRVDEALAGGKSFREVALLYSDAPPVIPQGGTSYEKPNLPPAAEETLQGALKAAIAGKPDGHLTGWIRSVTPDAPLAQARFLLVRRNPRKERPITDAERELAVKRPMMLEQGRERNNFERTLQQKISSAKVEIPDRVMKEQWDAFVAEIKRSLPAQGSGETKQ